jgi:hypothetical protein
MRKSYGDRQDTQVLHAVLMLLLWMVILAILGVTGILLAIHIFE